LKSKERRRRQRVDVVLVVKGVEHFDLGHDTETLAEMDWAGDAEVECEESGCPCGDGYGRNPCR